MDISIFRHFDKATLEAMLTASFSALSNGQAIVEYTIGGRTVRKEYPMTYADYMSAVNWALENLDPDNYPPEIIATKVAFS